MAEKITPRSEDFPRWYQDVVLQAKLADHSPVKGCMVIRPNGYSIWERIQREFDDLIKAKGVRNAYFPLFIPESFIHKEAEHVEGFAPELAVVTHAGGKPLEENLVVRPTSETIINSTFSKWIQSYRDLPMKINQWANVVRWEMRTRLFLRTTEFLWQEGHTCHATADEAEDFAIEMLRAYENFARNVLAIPVIAGLKSESEKFAGALRTYCIEAMMQDKKALQAGTSHNLSTNFAKAFGTQYLSSEGKQEFVHQTSWGVSTRLIGGVIMTHSDDKGLVLPPRLAQEHVAIVPILGKKGNPEVMAAAEKLGASISEHSSVRSLEYKVGVKVDRDETKKPGWKFYEYELIGMPIRIEIGPRDLEKGQAVVVRRDLGEKVFLPLAEVPEWVGANLKTMQTDLLEKARKLRDENIHDAKTYEEVVEIVEKGGWARASWDLDPGVEQDIKKQTKATVRCILLDEKNQPLKSDLPGIKTGGKDSVWALFGKSY